MTTENEAKRVSPWEVPTQISGPEGAGDGGEAIVGASRQRLLEQAACRGDIPPLGDGPLSLEEGDIPTLPNSMFHGKQPVRVERPGGRFLEVSNVYTFELPPLSRLAKAGVGVPRPAATPRRQGGPWQAGLLAEGWEGKIAGCGPQSRCGFTSICGLCRARELHRSAAKYEAAFLGLNELVETDLWLCTATRTSRAGSPSDVAAFQAGVRLLDSALRHAGAIGVVWVYEAVVKHDEPGPLQCCEAREDAPGVFEHSCSMCAESGSRLPLAHLHAHGIVVTPKGRWLPWTELQALSAPRQVDPAWGNLDFKPRDSKHAFGYVAGYVSKFKETHQAAWFGVVAPQARLLEATGGFRGVASKRSVWQPGAPDRIARVTRVWHVGPRTPVHGRKAALSRSRDIARQYNLATNASPKLTIKFVEDLGILESGGYNVFVQWRYVDDHQTPNRHS